MRGNDTGLRGLTRRNQLSAGNVDALGAKLCWRWGRMLVAHYQRLMGSERGGTAKKDVNKKTFEAGMCMKTNKIKTECPKKSRTFTSKFRTFTSNQHDFCRKWRLCGDNW
jgi:hypothetical protein